MNALLLPQALLTGSLLGVLTVGMRRRALPALARWLAVLGVLAGLSVSGGPRPWNALFLCGALPLLVTMRSRDEVAPALVLGSLLGMTVLASARHLFQLFLGLELMSLPLYAVLYRLGRRRAALEAAIKYFFAGSLAGGLFLFGMSIHYAAAGSLALEPSPSGPALQMAVLLMGCAALFKIGAFPLHLWLPDAYEAAPPELAAFMSTSVKAAGFLLLLRLAELLPDTGYLVWILPGVSAATMTAGNLLALRQKNLSRLLAYSSISHVGYLLAGVWAGAQLPPGPLRASGVYVYLAVYLLMSSAAFLFLRLKGISEVSQLRGLGRRCPRAAACWALALLALAGVPPTGGFLAKLFVVVDLLRAGGTWLALALALNSVVGLGYYFCLIRETFLEEPEAAPLPAEDGSAAARALLAATALAAVLIGLWPGLRGWVEGCLAQIL